MKTRAPVQAAYNIYRTNSMFGKNRSPDHVAAFSALVNTMVELRRSGKVDHDTFSAIIKRAAELFVTIEATEKVDRVFSDKSESILNKVMSKHLEIGWGVR